MRPGDVWQAGRMNRRTLCLVGLLPAFSAVSARAQTTPRVATVGFLIGASRAVDGPWIDAFLGRLGELGWKEGATLTFLPRDVQGNNERAAALAADLVERKVDIIVTSGTPAAQAAKRATSTIPIVLALIADPVASGLVASLSRPGGNITGLDNLQSAVAGKRVGLLREMVPSMRRLGILVNPTAQGAVWEMESAKASALAAGLEVVVQEARDSQALDAALAALKSVDAMNVCADPMLGQNARRINEFALQAKIPAAWAGRSFLEGGALMSYGPNYPDLMRRAADYVDRILRGARPGDLPIEQAAKFDLAVNQRVARALGIVVPPTVLVSADDIID